MEEGYRESTAAWADVLRSLKQRGVSDAPLLAIGDRALGLWAALDEVFPTNSSPSTTSPRSTGFM